MGKGSKHTDFQKSTPRVSVIEKCASSTYTNTCKNKKADKGFMTDETFKDDRPRFEVHHIVCEISVSQRKDDYKAGTEDYIENCLWITDWDINNEHNLIGLPRNRRFRVDWLQEPDEEQWTPTTLPSHQVDHLGLEGYTVEVRVWLKETIWDNLQAKQSAPHQVDVDKIEKDLKAGQDEFLKRLRNCAQRKPGMREGWKHRGEKGYEKNWYKPFSMSQNPSPRNIGKVGGRGYKKAAVGALTKIKAMLP